MHIGDENSKIIYNFARNLFDFIELLYKIKFNTEFDIFIEKYKKNNRIDRDILDCYEAVCKLCNLKFLLPSEDHYNHRSEIEKLVKLLTYNDRILVQKLGIYFEYDTKPGYWHEKGEYIININKIFMKFFMIGDQFICIQMNLDNEDIVFLSELLEFFNSLKLKLLENRKKEEINHNKIIFKLFPKYLDINMIDLNDSELEKLYQLDDQDIRLKFAKILINNDYIPEVNQLKLEQEAKKPHTAFEISDFEFPIEIDNNRFYICFVIKSGKEIKSRSVSLEKVFHQLDRPFKEFKTQNPIVIFLTAKPSSQALMKKIKIEYSTFPEYIEVIEKENLAKLLKIYELL